MVKIGTARKGLKEKREVVKIGTLLSLFNVKKGGYGFCSDSVTALFNLKKGG